MYDNNPIDNAVVTVTIRNNKFLLLTNDKGVFQKNIIQLKADTVFIQISRVGYKRLDTILTNNNVEFSRLMFYLEISGQNDLDPVTVKAQQTILDVNRKTYRINTKEYITNASVIDAFRKIPDISIVAETIKLENRKNVIILIDDLESSYKDLERLTVEEIDKIEVVPNPSSIYSGDAPISLIRVFTKVKKQNFIKGDVSVYKGIRLLKQGLSPSISFKTAKLLFSSYLSYGTNNQFITQQLQRLDDNDATYQNSSRDVKGWQLSSSSKLKISLSKLSDLVISANTFGYNFDGSQDGSIKINNSEPKSYLTSDKEYLNRWNISANYLYNVNKNSQLYLKSRYYDYRTSNESKYSDQLYTNIYPTTISKTKEFSSEVVYNVFKLNVFRKEQFKNVNIGIKNINRKFDFQSENFNFKQYINSAYINSELTIAPKLTSSFSLLWELTKNKGNNIDKSYFNFLPVFSFLYKLNDTTDLHFDYSKRITRPGGTYLNPNIIFLSPTQLLKGNISLLPQIRNSYELAYSKRLKRRITLNEKIFFEEGNHFIVETYTNKNNQIITSYDNVGKYKAIGNYLSFSSILFKKLSVSLGSGVTYSKYSASSDSSIIRMNDGTTFSANVNASIKIRNSVFLSVYGNVFTPNYTLINKIKTNPIIGFSLSSVIIKDKLNIALNFNDLFALNKTTRIYSDGLDFHQFSKVENNTSNISISLSYRFGKIFNDRIQNNSITNDDLKTK